MQIEWARRRGKVVRIRDKMIHLRIGPKSVRVWSSPIDTWDWSLLALGKWGRSAGRSWGLTIDGPMRRPLKLLSHSIPLPLFLLSVSYSSFKLPIIFVHTHTPLDVSSPYSHIDTILDSSFKHRIFWAKLIARTKVWECDSISFSFAYNALRFVRIIVPHRNLCYNSKSTMKHQQESDCFCKILILFVTYMHMRI
jgi:hypothetical protein